MRGVCGYGRYDDDPGHVGCPRAKSDMTPCIARDGALAAFHAGDCVGCGAKAWPLLCELQQALGRPMGRGGLGRRGGGGSAADRLRDLVREITEPEVPR